MIKKIVLILLLFTINSVYADSTDISLDTYNLDASISDTANDILGGEWSWDFNTIIYKVISLFSIAIKRNLSSVALIFIIGVISSVLLNLKSSLSSETADGGLYAAYIIVAVIAAKGIGIIMNYSLELVGQLDVHIKTVVPVVMSIAIASGAVISSGVIHPLIIGISQFVAFAVSQWLMPLVSIICGMCVINNMTNKGELSGIIGFAQKAIRWSCGILMTAFIGIMTVQGMITPALDSVAGKVTRYAIANFVPVVGGLISESVSIVAGYSAAMKGAVGGAGIIAMAVLCLKPLIEVSAVAILYNLTAAILRPVCDKRITSLLNNFGQVASILLILIIMMMLMFIINICMAVGIGGIGSVM